MTPYAYHVFEPSKASERMRIAEFNVTRLSFVFSIGPSLIVTLRILRYVCAVDSNFAYLYSKIYL